MTDKLSFQEFRDKVAHDPQFRSRVTHRLTAALKELGLEDKDLHPTSEAHVSERIFITTRDSHRNESSIIIF